MRKHVNYQDLSSNYSKLQVMCGKEVIAVLKNNGYNCGLIEVASALALVGCKLVMVTNVAEAISIKNQIPNLDVLIATVLDENDFEQIKGYKFDLMVESIEYLEKYKLYLYNHNLHLKVNVGMNRFGVDTIKQAKRIINQVSIIGLYAHMPLENEDDHLYNQQIERFIQFYNIFTTIPKYVHLENSYTMQRYDSRLNICNYVRIGILLYGYGNQMLTSSVTVGCKVVKVRDYNQDDTFSYGLDNKVKAGMKVATIDIGYGDGVIDSRADYPFYIKNRKYFQIGKQSMSHTYILVDNYVEVNDCVEVYGSHFTIFDHASKIGYPCSKLISYLN